MELEDDVSRGHPSRSHAAQPDFPFPFPSLAHRAHRVDPAPSTGMSIGRRPQACAGVCRLSLPLRSSVYLYWSLHAQHSRAKKSVRLVTAKHNWPTAVDRRHTDERSPAPSPTPTPKRRSPRRSSLNLPPPHASPCRTLTAPPRGTLWIRTTTRTDDPSARPVNAHGPRHERCASVENTRAASAWTAPVHPRPSRRRAPMGK